MPLTLCKFPNHMCVCMHVCMDGFFHNHLIHAFEWKYDWGCHKISWQPFVIYPYPYLESKGIIIYESISHPSQHKTWHPLSLLLFSSQTTPHTLNLKSLKLILVSNQLPTKTSTLHTISRLFVLDEMRGTLVYSLPYFEEEGQIL